MNRTRSDSGVAASPRPHPPWLEAHIFAGRLFTHWWRFPAMPVQSLLLPSILVVTYAVLVGRSMTRVTGTSKLEVLIPICALAGAMAGTTATAYTVIDDQTTGLLTRMWVLPVRRFSALGGMLLAEGARTFLGTVVLVLVGYLLNFRLQGNWLTWVLFALIPVAVVIVYGLFAITLGTMTAKGSMLTWLNTAMFGLVFSSAAPTDVVPSVLRPVVRFQPMAAAVESMQTLSLGRDATTPLIALTMWLVLLAAIFAPLAMRGYRKAAQTPPVQ